MPPANAPALSSAPSASTGARVLRRPLLAALLCFAAAETWFLLSALTLGGADPSRLMVVPAVGLVMAVGAFLTYVIGCAVVRYAAVSPSWGFGFASLLLAVLIVALSAGGDVGAERRLAPLVLVQYTLSGLCWGAVYYACCLLAHRLARRPARPAAAGG